MESWKEPFLMPPEFCDTKAFHQLNLLRSGAPCLSDPGVITEERLAHFVSHGPEFDLLYGFERVDDEIISALSSLAEERRCLEQMEQMLAGRPVNWIEKYPSEQRPALHTSMRAISSSAQKELDALKRIEQELFPRFDTMLFIGIGGSELGPRAICEALKPYWKKGRRVLYAGNVDPDELTLLFREIDPKKTVVVVVSKSGTTIETATNEARARDFFQKHVSSVRDHFISVTCERTPMDNVMEYGACLHLFDYVGGRYSITSMVGAVLIAFMAGVDVFEQFLSGARAVDETVLEPSLKKNIPLAMALLGIWNRNFLGYPTVAVIPYSSLLHRFPAHLQQCDMESNGKMTTRTGRRASWSTGPVIWGEPGTNAQHSFFQLLHQGSDTIPVEFIGFSKTECGADFMFRGTTSHQKLMANMFAQACGLATGMKSDNPNKHFSGNRPSLILLGTRPTPSALGALLSIYEHKIAFQGFIWGINSFDQEGVQLGKIMADRLLAKPAGLSRVEAFFKRLIGEG